MPQTDLDMIIKDMEKAAQLLKKRAADVSSPKRDKADFDEEVEKTQDVEGLEPVEGAGSAGEEKKKKEAEKLANEILRTFKGNSVASAFHNGLRSQGAPFLNKVSSVLGNQQPVSEGALYVTSILQQVAAYISQYAPTLQQMLANGQITEEEKKNLVDTLSSAETITVELLREATSGLQNQEKILEELVKLLEGDNPPMEVGAPVTHETATKTVQAALRKLYWR